jgi:hypothetical protein
MIPREIETDKREASNGKGSPVGGQLRITSPKQIEANRRNAMQSTGPRTAAGKEVSRANAIKHGVRAEEVVIMGQENPAESEELYEKLCDDWKPVGHTETNLVRELAIAEWRQRRARRAELGEIRNENLAVSNRDPAEQIAHVERLYPSLLPKILRESSVGIDLIIKAVKEALDELASDGEISEATCKGLDRMFEKGTESPTVWLKVWFLDDLSDLSPEHRDDNEVPTVLLAAIEPDKKKAARKLLDGCLKELKRLKAKASRQEKLAREIERQRLSIPDGPNCERIQRYETAIDRKMFRLFDQLERLQRRRRGEAVPPPVNVNVSGDH